MYEPYYQDLPGLTLARQQIVLFINTILKAAPQNEILKQFDSSSIIGVPTHKHNLHNRPGPGFLPSSSSLSNSTAVTGNVSTDSSLLMSQPYTVSLSSSHENSATQSPVTIPSASSVTATQIQRGYMFPTIFPYHKKGIDISSSTAPTSNSNAAANTANSPQQSATGAPQTSNQIDNTNRPSAPSPVASSAPTNGYSNRPAVQSPLLPSSSAATDQPSAPTFNQFSVPSSSPAASPSTQNSQSGADPEMSTT